MISTLGWRSRLQLHAGKPAVYIEYIESTPWNLGDLVEKPRFSGVGIALLERAIQMSAEEGFAGRIALHSLPQSRPFYRRFMHDFGIDTAHVENLCYFEMSEDQAKEFINGRYS